MQERVCGEVHSPENPLRHEWIFVIVSASGTDGHPDGPQERRRENPECKAPVAAAATASTVNRAGRRVAAVEVGRTARSEAAAQVNRVVRRATATDADTETIE